LADNFLRDTTRDLKGQSLWWRDIMIIGGIENDAWFRFNVRNVLGNGTCIRFWHETWHGPVCLKDLFPQLYCKSPQAEAIIYDVGKWVNQQWVWNLQWSTNLTSTEHDAARELANLLTGIQPSLECADRRRWGLTQTGMFSVKSTYEFLQSREVVVAIEDSVVKALQLLWLNDVPSKVSIFGWRLLLSRLPTRMALARKNIIVNLHELSCIFYGEEQEELSHLLFNCPFSQELWKRIFKWMNVDFISFDEGWEHFFAFGALLENKKFEKARHVIWLATTWCLWRARNNVLFRGEAIDVKVLRIRLFIFPSFGL
jgi:hypothetical protein